KVDAPPGMAGATARAMREAHGGDFNAPPTTTMLLDGARGGVDGGIHVHSVRLPGLVAHQEVIFGGLGQILTIRHDSTSRESFMPGVLLAVRRIGAQEQPFMVGLESLLF